MSTKDKFKKSKMHKSYGSDGGVYGVGILGALYYFITTATGFWDGVWGVIQAVVWPAVVVFKLLESFYG